MPRNFCFLASALSMMLLLAGCLPVATDPSAPAENQSQAPTAQAAISEYVGPATRPFLMGFTPWPADLTSEGAAMARDFGAAHGDIVSVTLNGGIPWNEAL